MKEKLYATLYIGMIQDAMGVVTGDSKVLTRCIFFTFLIMNHLRNGKKKKVITILGYLNVYEQQHPTSHSRLAGVLQ